MNRPRRIWIRPRRDRGAAIRRGGTTELPVLQQRAVTMTHRTSPPSRALDGMADLHPALYGAVSAPCENNRRVSSEGVAGEALAASGWTGRAGAAAWWRYAPARRVPCRIAGPWCDIPAPRAPPDGPRPVRRRPGRGSRPARHGDYKKQKSGLSPSGSWGATPEDRGRPLAHPERETERRRPARKGLVFRAGAV